MRKLTKRSAAVLTGAAVLVIGAGAAFAAIGWSIDGTGRASGKAAEVKALTATSTFAGNLYPGARVELATRVKNPNEFTVTLDGTVGVAGATVTPADANATDCQNTLVGTPGIIDATFPGTPDIPPGPESDVPASVRIGDLPQTCAGKTIKIDYTFKGVSKAA
ncbi:hypothetical protein [Actinoplanes teichomyceticus]|uniref:Ribosomally synthesized peptide with SipW-like signal peptide n=1 Tax=Actinoplanes teichomyceticus TaxID=1867 RepID=A0A561WPC1_ACTTI|nr:hypothetical protein [Actinoplanes teichomyceticus]TWG25714.1 hypothetical protein FHX34_101686 [Actinoplanes teichomyceticus]GIF10789.1 hypothetical protein Ate01nite_08210 [Actinoplanes teichomyceticus]